MKFDVVLEGAYGTGNLGDDVLFDLVYGAILRHTSAERIAIVSNPTEYLVKRAPQATFLSRRDNYFAEAKLHVYGGGTQFFIFKNPTTLPKQLLFALKNPRYAWQKLTGTALRTIEAEHVAMLGIGLGPFEADGGRINRIVNRLKSCSFVGVRDSWSQNFCESNGIASVLAADLAFSSTFRNQLSQAIASTPVEKNGRTAFIVRDWVYGGDSAIYLQQVTLAANQLLAQGTKVDFIVFSRDANLDRSQFSPLGPIVQWCPDEEEPVAFLAKLRAYESIVTARFHGAVFAYLMDISSIGIVVDPKLGLFYEQIGQPYQIWSHPFDPDSLISSIQKLNGAALVETEVRRDDLTAAADAMLAQFEKMMQAAINH